MTAIGFISQVECEVQIVSKLIRLKRATLPDGRPLGTVPGLQLLVRT